MNTTEFVESVSTKEESTEELKVTLYVPTTEENKLVKEIYEHLVTEFVQRNVETDCK